jgi:hypothetical protein
MPFLKEGIYLESVFPSELKKFTERKEGVSLGIFSSL